MVCFKKHLKVNFIHNSPHCSDPQGNPFFPMVMNYRARIVCDNAANPTGYKIIRDFQNGTTNCLLEPVSRYDWANCELSIEDDFKKIKEMGFNAVRLLMAPSRNNNTANDGGFHYDVIQFNNSGTGDADALCAAPKKNLNLGSANNYTTTDAQIYFNAAAHALDVAASHGLKVIFFCADGSGKDNATGLYYPQMGSSESDAEDYAGYLSALAAAVKSKPAIMAYDIFNEPSFSWYLPGRNMNKDKQTVCSYVSQWYDALKTADSNHLVTIGGTGDVVIWDEGVMKVDFVSVHFYPTPNQYTAADPLMASEAMLNMIKWYGSAIQKPWIIGETGFISSDEACLIPYLWGSNNDLHAFISDVLSAVIGCGGSGFSWWEFQDVHYYCVPDEVCNPTCNYCNREDFGEYGVCGHHTYDTNPNQLSDAIKNVQGNYFGYLKYGDPDGNGNYSTGLEKESTGYIKTFDPSANYTFPATTNDYYNPWGFAPTANSITGTVKDQNGNSIKDAMVIAHSIINNPPTGFSPDFPHYTFTDNIGFFIINPAPTFDQDNPTYISEIRISYPAAEQKIRNSISGDEFINISNGEAYTLKKFDIRFNEVINGRTINGEETLQGWNSLSIASLTVNSGAVSELKARNEIHITGETHIVAGSEVHIYPTETFTDCEDFTAYSTERKANPLLENNSEEEVQNNLPHIVEISFRNSNISVVRLSALLDVSLIPNPNAGIFTVKINNEIKPQQLRIKIKNPLGELLKEITGSSNEFTVDTKNISKGIYFLEISADKQTITKKLIIQ